MLHTQLNLPQLAAAERNDNGDVEVQQRVPGSPPDQAYGSERGQHRFVLEFHSPPAEDMDASTPKKGKKEGKCEGKRGSEERGERVRGEGGERGERVQGEEGEGGGENEERQ